MFKDVALTINGGSISNGESVTVKAIENEVAFITYNLLGGGTKDRYVPLSHLDTEYWGLYIKKMKEKGTPQLKNGWYTYYNWRASQIFNDPTSSANYHGHLGLDVVNIVAPVSRAVYGGIVKFAGRSTVSNGSNSANGYVVQIEHTYSKKTFYSFYAHLRPDSICVSVDQNVVAGEIIGLMGHTTNKDNGGGMADHTHVGIYSGKKKATGQQWGYFRDSTGKKVIFDEKHGYKDGHIKFDGSIFYNVQLWDKILKVLQN
ncbi:hypothetical protein AN1V17_39850 [Vallitalea sediminicola]